ncbi:TonB-dependent receptor plug domain-containing protein [Limibacterium fermenti]|uniref:TonB-dependent receptor plug domain-containing protein n=1 Tax=Limibacterium fermenti TaxID=3229863 RepID=UPI003A7A7EF1
MNKRFLSALMALICTASLLHAQEYSDETQNLDEVVVTATRMGLPLKNIPQKVEIIDSKKIATIPADNAADLLKKATNIDIVQYPGALGTVGMRGFSPSAHSRSYTILMIDGLPSGTSNLTTLPTSIIDRIEVVKGPYSVLYGTDAMGGVINIITKKATLNKEGQVTIKGGSFGTTNFDANASGMLSDKLGIVAGFSNQMQQKDFRIGGNNLLKMNKTEKLILSEKSYGDIYPNTTYQMSQLFGKLNYAINDQWNASVSSFYNMAYDVKSPGNYFTQSATKKDINRLNVFGELAFTPNEKNRLTISPYYSNEKNSNYDNAENDKSNFISFKDNVSEYGVRTNYTHDFGPARLLTGIDYDVLDYKSDRQSKKGTEASPYKPDNRNQRFSAFAQINYNIENLSINAGARANYITYEIFKHDSLKTNGSSDNYFYFNPSLGLKYNLPRGFNVHASVGTAFSIPDAFATSGFYEVNTIVSGYPFKRAYQGNADLKPETSVTYEGGIGYTQGALYFDLTYFNTDHKNKIVEKTVNDTTFYNNAESANMSGVELLASVNIARLAGYSTKLEVYGGWTYMLNYTFVEKETKKKKDLLLVNRANANFGIYYENNDGFSTRLHARYKGSRLEENKISTKAREITEDSYYAKGGYEKGNKVLGLPDHLIFDYSAYYNVTPQARVGISIANLFDENYTEKDGYNMPGRSIMGSFTYSF